jgi:hypothetical protein
MAILVASLKLDFAAMGAIRNEVDNDIRNIGDELDRFSERITGATRKALQQREALKSIEGMDFSNEDKRQPKNTVTLKAVQDEKSLIEVRSKLAGINENYVKDLNTLQAAQESGLITGKEYVKLVSELASETYRKSAAGKEAARVEKQSGTDYDSVVKSIKERIAVQKLDLETIGSLTEGQKFSAKLQQDIKDGNTALTKSEREKVAALLQSYLAVEQLNISQKNMEKANIAASESKVKFIQTLDKELDKLNDEIQKQKIANAEIGLSKGAIAELTSARLEDEAAVIEIMAVKKLDKDLDFYQYELYKKQAQGLRELAALKREGSFAKDNFDTEKKRMEELEKEFKRVSGEIEKTLTDALIKGFDSGKTFAENFKDTLENIFKTMVLKPIVQAVVTPVSQGFASGFAGTTGASGSGGSGFGLSNISGMLSSNGIGYGIANTANIMSGVAGGVGPAAPGTLGSLFSGAGQYSNMSYGIAGVLGGFAGGALFGDKGYASAGGSAGSTLGMAIGGPIGAVAGTVIGSALGSLLGDDGPEKNTSLRFTSNNAAGATDVNKRGNEGDLTTKYLGGTSASSVFGDYGVDQTFWANFKGLPEYFAAVSKTDELLAKSLSGEESNRVKSALTGKQFTVGTGEEGTDTAAALGLAFKDRVSNIFNGIEDGLSSLISDFKGSGEQLASEASALLEARKNIGEFAKVFDQSVTLQSIAALRKEGETASAAINRLVVEFTLTTTLSKMLGKDTTKAFGDIGLASTNARERLINLAGGVDALASKTSFFYENFFTEQERLAPVIEQVNYTFKDLGISMVSTKDEFKNLVKGLDLSSESGAKTFATLMNLAPSFLKVAEAAEVASKAVIQNLTTMAERTQKIFDSVMSALQTAYNDESGVIQGKIAKANEQIKNAYSSQLSLLESHLQDSETALQDSYSKQNSLLNSTLNQFEGFIKSLTEYQTSLLLGEQSNLGKTEKYSVASQAFDKIIQGKNAGNAEAIGGFQSGAKSFLDASGSSSRTAFDYALDVMKVRIESQSAIGVSQEKITDAQRQLIVLDKQVEGLLKVQTATESVQSAIEKMTTAKQEIALWQRQYAVLAGMQSDSVDMRTAIGNLATAEQELKALDAQVQGILTLNTSVLSVREAVLLAKGASAANNDAQAALQTAKGTTSEQIVASWYSKNPNAVKSADMQNIPYWTSIISQYGVEGAKSAFSKSVASITGTNEVPLTQFAVGTNFVPGDMPAIVHEGERIIPAADNRKLMDKLEKEEDNQVAAEIRALRAEILSANIALAKNTGEMAKYIRLWNGDGLPAERTTS